MTSSSREPAAVGYLTPSDLENLEAGGIPPWLARQAGIFRVTDEQAVHYGIRKSGHQDLGGIMFPYVDLDSGNVCAYRLRRDNPELERKDDGTLRPRAKYLSPVGQRNRLYVPPGLPPDWMKDPSVPIVLLEGEKKCLVVHFLSLYGLGDNTKTPQFVSLGISGAHCWKGRTGKTENANGKRVDVYGSIPDLDRITWAGRSVTPWPDANFKTDPGVSAGWTGFAENLKQRGAVVHFAMCPAGPGVNGPDDGIKRWGPEWGLDELHKAWTVQDSQTPTTSWPSSLSRHAFHGVAGDIVRAIEPHSEADPSALLIQTLTMFGNVVGSAPHFMAEADRHAMKLFTVIVGVTSKGRKGTSLGYVRALFQVVDSAWAADRVQTGLASGEGLIWAVRDPIVRREQVQDDEGNSTGQIKEVVEDPGVEDKRLLPIETEFASTLRVMKRETNTLSPIMRQAWDAEDLRTLTKNSPAKATGTHISVIGQITRDELIRCLPPNEVGNGFANRFLWVCSRRSKMLPEGGRVHEVDLQPLVARLKEAVEFARTVGELRRDEEARQMWISVYPKLSQGFPGVLGSVLSRAEAQVMRIACIYALLDCSEVIRRPHLLAALAVWEYVESSARFIFGDSVGDAIADTILDALRQRPEGLTRTEISKLLGNNRKSQDIDRALGLLSECGLARHDCTQTGGRPSDRWHALGTE